MNITQLKLNGYAVTVDGNSIDAHPGAPVSRGLVDPAPRFQFMRLAIIRFDVERGNARDLIEQIIAEADISPRALVGRKRDGSAVILFRFEKDFPISPNRTADTNDGAYKLAAKDDSARFSLTVKSEGQTLDVSEWTWVKGRSPLEVSRDALPVLTVDVSTAVVEAAREIGTTAFAIEYQRKSDEESEKLRARMVTGEIPATLQKQADAEDDALVAQYEGQDVNTWNMGNAGMLVQQARARVAAREAAKVDPVANDARGLRRLRSMFGG